MLKVSNRESNIELLRVIGMIMIVAYHYAAHGVIQSLWGGTSLYWDRGIEMNQKVCALMLPGGAVGVCVFFLITGYFQIEKDEFSLRKVVCQIWFCAMLTSIIGVACILARVTMVGGSFYGYIFKAFTTPITANIWWFATSSIVLMFLSPYINRLFVNVSKKGAVALVLIAWAVSQIGIALSYQYSMFVFPVFYYLLGAYIKLYGIGRKLPNVVKLILSLSLWLANSALWYMKYTGVYEFTLNHSSIFNLLIQTIQFAFLVPASGVILMELFRTFNIQSKIINLLGSVTFGVYLLHDSGITRPLIWNNILKVGEQFLSKYFPLHALLSIVIVYVFCGLLDILRQLFFEKIQYSIWDKIKNYFKI